MFNQNRIYRVFQLINFLRARPSKSIKNIMQFLDTSERTVYRYLDMLKDLGFKVERDTSNRVWISASGNLDVVPFTPQEADFLEKLGKTEAAFLAFGGTGFLKDFRIEYYLFQILLFWVTGSVQDEHLIRQSHLRCGEANSVGIVHALEHFGRLLAERVSHPSDPARLEAQGRMGIKDDGKHAGFPNSGPSGTSHPATSDFITGLNPSRPLLQHSKWGTVNPL